MLHFSLKVQEMQVSVETKTGDDVFVKLLIAVAGRVDAGTDLSR